MTTVALPSFAVAFLVVSCALLARKRHAHGGGILVPVFMLLAAVMVTEQFILNPSNEPLLFARPLIVLESFLPFLFLFYGFRFSRTRAFTELALPWRIILAGSAVFPVAAALVPMETFLYSPDIQSEKIVFLKGAGYWFYMGQMIYCILALVNLEATFSSAGKGEQWKIKFELFGMGSVFAMFVFYFSQGLLYRTINMNLIPMRSVVVILAVAMVLYSRLVRGNNVNIAVSMDAAYKSFTIFAVGLYLLMLGLLGEGMRHLGVAAGTEVTVFLAFLTGIALLLALASGRIRRRASVLIRKHFFRHKYDYRAEWLKYTRSLSSCTTLEEVRQKILSIFADTFGLKGASLLMRQHHENVFRRVAWHGSAMAKHVELNASDGLLAYFKEEDRVFNPGDGEYSPTDDEKAFVQHSGAGLMVPLMANDAVQGVIVFGGQLSRERYIYEDFDLMKTLAREASLTLSNLHLSEELSETREIAAVARISSFVIHDLKNQTSALSMMLANAGEHIGDPEFQQDMLGTLQGTVARMRELMQKLKRIPEKQSLEAAPVELLTLARSEAEELKRARPDLEFRCEGIDVVASADREEMKKVVLNLLLNACEATGGKGVVSIQTQQNGRTAGIRVADNGCGMEKDFVENHLFKPFRTTKKKGLGVGLYQCKQIVEAHGGRIEVQSSPESGTAFTVQLPLYGE